MILLKKKNLTGNAFNALEFKSFVCQTRDPAILRLMNRNFSQNTMEPTTFPKVLLHAPLLLSITENQTVGCCAAKSI